MVSRVERERKAIADAEKSLEEKRARLVEIEREEEDKTLARLLKKVGQKRAIRLLELSVEMKPKLAIEALEERASQTVQAG